MKKLLILAVAISLVGCETSETPQQTANQQSNPAPVESTDPAAAIDKVTQTTGKFVRAKGQNVTIDQVLSADKLGGTPLEKAIRKGDVQAVRTALSQGADPNQMAMSQIKINGLDGYTCLHLACELGHADIVKVLLEKHANRRAQTSNGKTPKDMAAEKGHQDVLDAFSP